MNISVQMRTMGFQEIIEFAKIVKLTVANFEERPSFDNVRVIHHCVIICNLPASHRLLTQ